MGSVSEPSVLLSLLSSSSCSASSLSVVAHSLPSLLSACSSSSSSVDGSSSRSEAATTALLSSPLGRAHAEALSSILDVEREEAAKITTDYMESFVRKGGFFAKEGGDDDVDGKGGDDGENEGDDFTSISPCSSPLGTLPFLRLCIHHHYNRSVYRIRCLEEVLRIDLTNDHPLEQPIKEFLDGWLDQGGKNMQVVAEILDSLVKGWERSFKSMPYYLGGGGGLASSSSGASFVAPLFAQDVLNLSREYAKSKEAEGKSRGNDAKISNQYEMQRFQDMTRQQVRRRG